jgi:MFS family permease
LKKEKKNNLSFKELKHQARRYSIKEGIFAHIQGSLGGKYISPFAIAINSSNSIVALLTAVSGLLGPLAQVFSSRLIEKYPRKKIVVMAVLFELLMWLPFIVIAILFYFNILVNLLPFLVLFSFSLYVIMGNIASPAWFSWMGDIVDEKYRGRWFSKRGLILGFVAGVFAILSAFLLNYFKSKNWTIFGFIILFFLAFITRLISWRILRKQYEPKIKLKKGYYFSFWDFLKKAPETNFGKFAIFRALLGFSVSISSSLLAIYLLRNLNLSYVAYMIIIFSASAFSLLVLNLWGVLADKYGNYRILVVTTIFIPIVPILWILSKNPIYMIFVPSLISGISWAGFDLSASNFVYDNVSSQKRGLAVSYLNLLNGIGVFFGASLSAILIKYLTVSFIEPLFLIYILGGIMRMGVVFWWIPKMDEIKKTKKFGSSRVFKNVILRQVKPTFIEEAQEILSIKKYLTIFLLICLRK